MDAATLAEVGKALYGSMWQTEMARALGISPRIVRFWLVKRPIPAWAWEQLATICTQRAEALNDWKNKLPQYHQVALAGELADRGDRAKRKTKLPSAETTDTIKTVHHNINHA